MSFTSGPVFTAAGEALLARAIAGEALTFTRIVLGDGELGSATIRNLTAPIHQVSSVDVASIRRVDNRATVAGLFTNADLTTGFYWREIGLLAANPDNPSDRSADILYCYQNAGTMADFIPASDSELITKRVAIAAIVSDAANVTATLGQVTRAADVLFDNTDNGMTATDTQAAIEELNEKKQDASSAITEQKVTEIAAGKAGDAVTAHNNSDTAHSELFNSKASKAELTEAEKKALARSAHNLLVDGGFELGTEYWENYNPTYYSMARGNGERVHGYRSLQVTTAAGNTSGSNFSGPYQTFAGTTRLGHVIYFACMAKAAAGLRPAISLGYAGADMSNYRQAVTANGDWQRISRRVALGSSYYPNNLYLGLEGNFDTGAVVYFDDAIVVDLTDLFGAGNEPTQAWCDANIEYFNTAAAVNEWQALALLSTLEATMTT